METINPNEKTVSLFIMLNPKALKIINPGKPASIIKTAGQGKQNHPPAWQLSKNGKCFTNSKQKYSKETTITYASGANVLNPSFDKILAIIHTLKTITSSKN